PGAVAQLGERIHGMDEVRGSIPLGSTDPDHPMIGGKFRAEMRGSEPAARALDMRARFASVAISIVLIACSQPPPPADDGDSQDNASTSKKKAPAKDAGNGDDSLSDNPFGDDGSDPPPPPAKTTQADCTKTTSQDACFKCCQDNNPK